MHPPRRSLPGPGRPARCSDRDLPLLADHVALTAAAVRTSVEVPLAFADGFETVARVFTFRGLADGKEHLALALGDWQTASTPLVRLHSECLTGDVLGSQRCDCGPQLRRMSILR